jgi:endonuclease/exonuclease/phosphatase family metal-dependent hydrolase
MERGVGDTGSGQRGTGLTVVTWNVNCFNPGRTGEKASLLASLDWDVALLQEVGRRPFERFAELEGVEGAEALALTGGLHHKRPLGAAILSRIGPLTDLEVLPGLPVTERFLAASVAVDGVPVRFASWHAPNAAGNGAETKMVGYAEVTRWAADQPAGVDVVLGADTNSWEAGWEQPAPIEPSDFFEEHRFLHEPTPHGLRDAFRAVLADDPERLAGLLARRPGRALATTYRRGTKNDPVAERMDRLFVSAGISCHDVEHHFADAVAVGSDHALVRARLTLPRQGS